MPMHEQAGQKSGGGLLAERSKNERGCAVGGVYQLGMGKELRNFKTRLRAKSRRRLH